MFGGGVWVVVPVGDLMIRESGWEFGVVEGLFWGWEAVVFVHFVADFVP